MRLFKTNGFGASFLYQGVLHGTEQVEIFTHFRNIIQKRKSQTDINERVSVVIHLCINNSMANNSNLLLNNLICCVVTFFHMREKTPTVVSCRRPTLPTFREEWGCALLSSNGRGLSHLELECYSSTSASSTIHVRCTQHISLD